MSNSRQLTPSSSVLNPGVRFPPPFVFVLGLGLAWALESRVVRLPMLESSSHPLLVVGGSLCIVVGLGILLWGLSSFWSARTAILPFRPASRIVDSGPYRYSRNPMYVGMTLVYVGLALRLNWGWPLVLLPVLLVVLYLAVIRREERYLSAAFGEDYAEYRRRVRRWI